MMKNHDEGYVLAYVTVVLALFCLIATMILTGAMKNLNAQQDDIARMKDQYEAAGMIEKVVAQGIVEKEEVNKDLDGNVISALKVTRSDDMSRTVVAQYGSVVITCVIDTNGNYKSYQIGTVELTEDGGDT